MPDLIESAPGMEHIEAVEPSRAPIAISPDQVTPQMRVNAIGSPDAPVYGPNVHNGPVAPVAETAGQAAPITPTEALGDTVVGAEASLTPVTPVTSEQQPS